MTKEQILRAKENRYNKIINKGKSTNGVIRKLEREIRNLSK